MEKTKQIVVTDEVIRTIVEAAVNSLDYDLWKELFVETAEIEDSVEETWDNIFYDVKKALGIQ